MLASAAVLAPVSLRWLGSAATASLVAAAALAASALLTALGATAPLVPWKPVWAGCGQVRPAQFLPTAIA